MRAFSTVFLTLSLFFVISCTREVLRQNEIDPWLNTISGGKPPEIDITGRWRDTQGSGLFSWGDGYLHQEQNKISGVIGEYIVTGIVSGKIVYLVFLYRDRIYYTARLELSQQFVQDELVGSYFKAKDKEQKKPYPTSFTKLKER
jgi:hypothetical protein